MPKLIEQPVLFHDEAVRGDEIREYFGRISTKTDDVSVGILSFTEGWSEPPQTPEFDEYSIVLEGALYIDTDTAGTFVLRPGQSLLTPKGERIRYRTPESGGAKYVALCLPAFTAELTHREKNDASIRETDPARTLLEYQPQTSPFVFLNRPALMISPPPNRREVEEYIGRINGGINAISIARVKASKGWTIERLASDFDMFNIVLDGELLIESREDETITVRKGQGAFVKKNTMIRYRASAELGAVYFSICLPAFDPNLLRKENVEWEK